jgi:hypothetical protein
MSALERKEGERQKAWRVFIREEQCFKLGFLCC